MKIVFRLLLLVGALSGFAQTSHAQKINTPDGQAEILFLADDMEYDQSGNRVTAVGNVEVSYGQYVLLADRMTYDRAKGIVYATGNVSLLEDGGNVVFADHVELTDDFKEGLIRQIRTILADNSRMAAVVGYRRDENITELSKAVYSPCKICQNASEAPVWQLKAYKVTRDLNEKRISYEDAFLEIKGVPVLYTPYFAHPDPSVDRQSGFLAPIIGTSSDLGTIITTPYYFAISPSQDFTLLPSVTTKEGPIIGGEYRRRFDSGALQFSGSMTYPDERDDFGGRTGDRDFRGHLFGAGSFRINQNWNWGFQIERASDETYLKRYDISNKDELTSRLYAAGYDDLSSASIDAYAFQGLRAFDNDDTTPVITPLIDYQLVGDPGVAGGRFFLNANALVLSREQGTDTRRLSVTGGWRLPFIGSDGGVYDFMAALRGDIYHVDNFPDPTRPNGIRDSGFEYRALPLLSFQYSYPLVSHNGSVRQVLEPIVSVVYSGESGNNNDIPNEDSGSFEFDDTNLFSVSRFPGLDRWEEGSRASVGVKWSAYGLSGGSSSVLLGQVFRLDNNRNFAKGTGLEGNRSDYVGRITVSPTRYVDLTHRFRLNKDDLSYARSEVTFGVGPSWLRLNGGYLRLDDTVTTTGTAAIIPDREEARLNGVYRFHENWRMTAYGRRDLDRDQMVNYGGGIYYQDECLFMGITFKRSFTRDRDISPNDSIGFELKLINLGGEDNPTLGTALGSLFDFN